MHDWIDGTILCLFPLLSVILAFVYWWKPHWRWYGRTLLLLGISFAIYSTGMDLFFGEMFFYYMYWLMLLVSLGGIGHYAGYAQRHRHPRRFLALTISAFFLTILLASYVRIVPRADTYATCQLQQYGLLIEAYYQAYTRYPRDIYARGHPNPQTLGQTATNDVANACRPGGKPWSQLYRPYGSTIRYDPQPTGYMLRSFYTYDPLFIGLQLYRTCIYAPTTTHVTCHFQLTQPFEPPLNNY